MLARKVCGLQLLRLDRPLEVGRTSGRKARRTLESMPSAATRRSASSCEPSSKNASPPNAKNREHGRTEQCQMVKAVGRVPRQASSIRGCSRFPTKHVKFAAQPGAIHQRHAPQHVHRTRSQRRTTDHRVSARSAQAHWTTRQGRPPPARTRGLDHLMNGPWRDGMTQSRIGETGTENCITFWAA